MKMRNIILILSAALLAAVFAPRIQAQAGTETMNIIDSSCTISTPCTLQLYKATLASGAAACPAAGDASYAPLTMTQVGSSIGIVNTAWSYVDSVLVAGSTYCYYATVTYPAGGAASPPSAIFEVAIPVPTPTAAPMITGSFSPTA
jgi:hypothetical protein